MIRLSEPGVNWQEDHHQIMLGGAAICLVYVVVFVSIAIGREDRHRYLGKLRSIAGRPALETA